MPSEPLGQDNKVNGNVHDDESSRARTRVSRACTRCRARKDRCDGLQPSCTACLNAEQPCCYEPSTKKRGLPEGYVRGLEKLFALLIGKVDGFEDVTSTLLRDNRVQLVKLWNHVAVGEELHTTWKESTINSELESLLSSIEQSTTAAGQKRKRGKDDEVQDHADASPSFHTQPSFHLSNYEAGQTARLIAMPATRGSISLPKQSLQLLDQYFTQTNCWFPILRRSDLTRACYEIMRGQVKDSSHSLAPLLWAVFAYTRKQLSTTPQNTDLGSSAGSDYSAEEMQQLCIDLLPSDVEKCNLSHAQSMLIIALLEVGNGRWKAAWISIGKAVRIVLSTQIGSVALSEPLIGVLQGCIILDTCIAAHFECVPHLRTHDLAAVPLLAEDGHEEWEPWNGSDGSKGQREPSFSISFFNRLTKINLIINEMLTVYRPASSIGKDHAQNLLAKLHDLQADIPGQMPPTARSPPHQIYLQICHVSAQMRLVELPVETGARANERAQLACNFLSLLTLCKNASGVGLKHLPPFLADGFGAALRLAHDSKTSFGPLNNLPTFEDVCQTAKEYLTEVSNSWPAYQVHLPATETQDLLSLQRDTMSISPRSSKSVQALNAFGNSAHRRGENLQVYAGLHSSHQQSNTAPRSFNPFSNPFASGDLFATGEPLLPNHSASIDVSMTLGSGIISSAHAFPNSFDSGQAGTPQSNTVERIMVEASPSFHGDEIDAIFHEMAHLDTNEWHSERATEFKDFGFQDDLTFQAFCNDPDRLINNESGAQPLSSSLQSWMFTGNMGQPP